MQRIQQHALTAARVIGVAFHPARAAAIGMAALCGGLHAATAMRPAIQKPIGPGWRVLVVLIVSAHLGVAAVSLGLRAFFRRLATRLHARWRAFGLRNLRHHAGLGQGFVQTRVQLANGLSQVALAKLDHHQAHFRRQVAGGECFVDRHAQMFRTDRVGVGHQFQTTGNPAQTTVDPRQHLLEVAQQYGGKVAHRQP